MESTEASRPNIEEPYGPWRDQEGMVVLTRLFRAAASALRSHLRSFGTTRGMRSEAE
jgi:hypothetical protein